MLLGTTAGGRCSPTTGCSSSASWTWSAPGSGPGPAARHHEPARHRGDPPGRTRRVARQPSEWFGIRHAQQGRAVLLFQPTLRSDAPTPAGPVPTAPDLGDQDFFWPADELFPDFLQLAVASESERREAYAAARASVGDLPGASGTLTHDATANLRVLDGLVSELQEAIG